MSCQIEALLSANKARLLWQWLTLSPFKFYPLLLPIAI